MPHRALNTAQAVCEDRVVGHGGCPYGGRRWSRVSEGVEKVFAGRCGPDRAGLARIRIAPSRNIAAGPRTTNQPKQSPSDATNRSSWELYRFLVCIKDKSWIRGALRRYAVTSRNLRSSKFGDRFCRAYWWVCEFATLKCTLISWLKLLETALPGTYCHRLLVSRQ